MKNGVFEKHERDFKKEWERVCAEIKEIIKGCVDIPIVSEGGAK